ncbi:galactose-1-phosphate uridylyltransferase [Sinomonas cellulolyticus]|uniref:Galactose-1-phosphate uridylyltransferase n=1 Tax=Sinomonas cellulolyticus TaxID=2801916 RepID=A0ABS1JZB1_9MICC|nr:MULTISPECIES: galactose-1-phosphate uridylyltransferase [Sinomonas]MBL0704462.1 galactose-1-phosphate uridylyltransferase [Sinomonas cellulolyticus]GHG48812.1 galactose-1-phosphate uridylyltransferase [Sinomonas sp. KCTC 49339]
MRRQPLITGTRLSDGRELIYFDDPGSPPRQHMADTRRLTGRAPEGELRYDELSGEWVAVAAHRQSRTHLPPADECPLCPSTPTHASEIPDPDYDVAVFENRFPSLGPGLAELPGSLPWGVAAAAAGRCEVVSFTSDHSGSFADLPYERARTVVEALAHRTAALSSLPGVRQVFPFENRGADIGVTLHHPHGQIYAYPYVTPRASQLGAAARRFYDHADGKATLLGSLLGRERAAGERMVLEGSHFSAFVPFAARWPLEVHLVPHRDAADFTSLTGEEKDELASVYLSLLGAVDALYATPTPYIAAWHQAPLDPLLRPATRFHLQLTSPRRAADKLKYLAGSEAAMGAFITDTTAEQVAERLRAVLGQAGRQPAGPGPAGSRLAGPGPRGNHSGEDEA